MSYSQTLHGPKNNTSSENGATPLKTRYNEELMFYVYQQVYDAVLSKSKQDLDKNDLNSINLIREAKDRASSSLTADLLLERGH